MLSVASVVLASVLISVASGQSLSCPNPLFNRNFRWSTVIPESNCLQPSSEAEVVEMVNMAVAEGAKIRAIGKSWNWGPGGMMENNNFYTGESQTVYTINMTAGGMTSYSIDTEAMTMTFEAGLRVIDVAEALEEENLGLENFGGPHIANFVGSFITGTHGKGSTRNPAKIMANDVIGFRMVLANGCVVSASATKNKDIFYGGLVSNGVLGIITEVTVQAVPLQYMIRDSNINWRDVTEFDDIERLVKTNLSQINQDFDGISGSYNVFRERFQWQRYLLISEEEYDPDNECWDYVEEGYTGFPCNDAYFRAISPFPTATYGSGRNHEVELFVSEDEFEAAYLAGIKWVKDQEFENPEIWNESFVVFNTLEGGGSGEIQIGTRVIGNDNIWLSPGYGNKNFVQVSLYIPGTVDERAPDYLYDFWNDGFYRAIRNEVSGSVRIHFGKASLRSYCDIKNAYPKFEDFIELREELDPNEVFLNAMMRDKLGVCDDDIRCCCTFETCLTREDFYDSDSTDSSSSSSSRSSSSSSSSSSGSSSSKSKSSESSESSDSSSSSD